MAKAAIFSFAATCEWRFCAERLLPVYFMCLGRFAKLPKGSFATCRCSRRMDAAPGTVGRGVIKEGRFAVLHG